MKQYLYPLMQNTWNQHLQPPLGKLAHIAVQHVLHLPERKPHYFLNRVFVEPGTIEERVHSKDHPNSEHLVIGGLYRECVVLVQSRKGEERHDAVAVFDYAAPINVRPIVDIANNYKQKGYAQTIRYIHSQQLPEGEFDHWAENTIAALKSHGVDFIHYPANVSYLSYKIVTDKGVIPLSVPLMKLVDISKKHMPHAAVMDVSPSKEKEAKDNTLVDSTLTTPANPVISYVKRLEHERQIATKKAHGK
jgi:hypothetical protein